MLDEAVKDIKQSEERRLEYMTGMMRDIENREEGRQEGTLNTQKYIISNMLKKGKSLEEIADLCGYTVEQISRILEDSKNI